MPGLDKAYIDAHRHAVHTPESWGRAIGEQVLNGAVQNLTGGGSDSVEVDAKFTVTKYEPMGCIQVCANINGVQVCYHINT